MSKLAGSTLTRTSDLSLLIRSAVPSVGGVVQLSGTPQLRFDTLDGSTAPDKSTTIFTFICWTPI